MTRPELVAQLNELAKPLLMDYFKELPAQTGRRLDGIEQEMQALSRELKRQWWGAVIEQLRHLAEQEAGQCACCGRKCSVKSSQVEMVVLGDTISVQIDYFYCRRCRIGRAPMRRWLGVHDQSPSSLFVRAVVALCLLRSFGEAAQQMKEQHGQQVDRTKAERVTYQVGKEAEQYLAERRDRAMEQMEKHSGPSKGVPLLELTADGAGAPVAKLERPKPEQATELTPKRKLPKGKRERTKREVRLINVHQPGQVEGKIIDLHVAPHGHPEVSGHRMYTCALAAGYGDNTRVHGVFDMGQWIHPQFEEQFHQEQHSKCADYYHTDEYLSGAAKALWSDEEQRRMWMGAVSDLLKLSETDVVAQQLAAHICRPTCPKDDHGDCLAKVALRYVLNHESYMDYARFVAEGLPIGSGEAEGGVRHWIRRRLDIPGAWREDHLVSMCALLTIKASGWWDDFWRWREERDVKHFWLRQQGQMKATTFRGTPRDRSAQPVLPN